MATKTNETVEMIKSFRADFKEVVKGLEQKYGCEISLGNISYTDIDFSGKLKVARKIDGKSVEQLEFEKYCKLFDMTPSDYGRRIVTPPTKSYILVGFNTKARTYPYIAKCLKTGNMYKLGSVKLV